MSDAMILVSNLTKNYAGLPAVHDLSFEIKKGEIIGFLGPNGAGKTTTMRILTGYMPPSSGKVAIAGMNVLDYPVQIRKKVGYLPENVPLYGEMRVTAYLGFIGQLKGLSKKELKGQVSHVIEVCGLVEVQNKIIDKLSKGYKQRVGLAQALIGDPDILILDEPTVGLDPKQIKEIRNLIKELGKERTVILSTHILPEVSQICNRVLIINKGKLVAQGTPDELKNMIKGKEAIFLSVQGEDAKEFKEFLTKKVPGIKSAKVTTEDKNINAIIESEKDLRSEITSAIVKSKKWDLMEIKKQEVNLEDIFLKLTTKDE